MVIALEKKIIKNTEMPDKSMSSCSSYGERKYIDRDTYEISEKAKAMLIDAEKQCKEKLKQADALLEHEKKKAYAEGICQGLEKISRQLASAQNYYEQVINNCEKDILDLAVCIAEKIIGDRVQREPEVVVAIARACVAQFKRQKNLVIRIHPGDTEIIERNIDELSALVSPGSRIQIAIDTAMQQGGIMLETETGHLDARIELQLELITNALKEYAGH
jgi:type III secretion system HrpE/YscL family protein